MKNGRWVLQNDDGSLHKKRRLLQITKNQVLQNADINAVAKSTSGDLTIEKHVNSKVKGGDIIEKLSEMNILHFVFEKIEAESIYKAAGVCKKWKDLLGDQSFIRSLYTSPTPHFSCGAFLVMFKYLLPRSRKEKSCACIGKYDRATFVMGAQGQCSVIEDYEYIFGVTCSGLICTIPDKIDLIKLHVINPAVKRGKEIIFEGLCHQPSFSGFSFNASTQALTFLEGYVRQDDNIWVAMIFDSSKRSREWRNLTCPKALRCSPEGEAVCSWGILWWVDKSLKNIVGYSIEKNKFFCLSLPANAVSSSTSMSGEKELGLKGGEGKVVLVSDKLRTAWELIKRNDNFVWSEKELNFDKFPKPNCVCFPCGLNPSIVKSHYMNSHGLWLIIRMCDFKGLHILLCDNTGKLIQCWSKAMSIMNMIVEKVWPFEINNICWPRA